MCLGGGKTPPKQSAAAPPAPPPADAPTSPALNESTTDATNANNAVEGARRGRSALRINLNAPSQGSGLTIQN